MKTICVDFDGVVHSYTSPWTSAVEIQDNPVEGVFQWIEDMIWFYNIAIYSARSKDPGGIEAMKDWFTKHGMSHHVLETMEFPKEKPPASLYIDDRAWLFTGPGTMPTREDIENFKPWNKLCG